MDASIHGAGRAVLVVLLVGVMSLACSQSAPSNPAKPALTAEEQALAYKFRGIHGIVTRIDAATSLYGTSIVNDKGGYIAGNAHLSPKNVSNSAYGGYGFPIPITIRATWREGEFKPLWQGGYTGGTIAGDYTVPVAERIPDEVLDYIRKNGGALRLKIRLHDKGVAIGWDVEHVIPYKDWKPNSLGLGSGVNYRMAGGDFKEARPATVVFEDGNLKRVPSSMPTPLSASDEAMLNIHDLMLVKGTIITNPPTPPNHQRVWEKGWYIDKNGKKVFTDY